MKKLLTISIIITLFAALFIGLGTFSASAATATEGYYTYSVSDGKATIKDVNTSISGAVTIPSTLGGYPVTGIGDWAFYECTGLTSVTIPDSVTSIGDDAFYECTGLTSVTIGNGVTEIPYGTFWGCTGLTSVTIPDSVTSIGKDAFDYCTGLTRVNITDVKAWCETEFNNYSSNPLCYAGNLYLNNELVTDLFIPQGTTSIAERAFYGCSNLTSVTIPDSVTSIGEFAFYKCTGLTSVTIPDSVTSIVYGTFWGCTGLTSVTIPDSVTSIGGFAFNGCSSLNKITLPFVGNTLNGTRDTHFSYIFGVDSYSGNIDYNSDYLPSSLKEVVITKATSIASDAFRGCTGLTSITIPDSVTSIGDRAFYNCTGLTSVTIPDSVTSIGTSAFSFCTGLTSVTIGNGVTSIGDYAFKGCSSLAKITLPFVGNTLNGTSNTHFGYIFGASLYSDNSSYVPSSLKEVVITKATSIGSDAFSDCTGLTSVTIGNGVTSIGERAFYRCTGLTSVSITDIKAWCEIEFKNYNANPLYYAKNLYLNGELLAGDLVIPQGTKCIAQYAFYDCDEITSVTIPGSVKSIGDCAFGYCYKLTDVWYAGDDRSAITIGSENYSLLAYVEWHYGVDIVGEHVYDKVCDSICNLCGATRTALAHKCVTTTTKATLSANGKKLMKCSVCGETSFTTIYRPYTFKLSTTNYTYNGSVKTPTVTVKDAAGKTISSSNYTVTYASGRKNAGTYTVKVTMKGNYSGTKTLSFKINPINISKCSVKLSATSYTYNGAVKTPTVTVKNASGTKLTKDTHYTVTYASGRKNAGTYKVTIKMKGNYTGSKTLTFKINPINVSKCELILSNTNYTYDGKSKLPSLTVLNNQGTKLTDSSYTVTYASGRKNVGTYKVTVKMKGNYTGSKTLTFKINPAKTTVSKLTPATKSLKVAITKKTTQVTGYQVQYSTSKSFKSVKTVTISSYKTTSTTIKSLKAKTTYYVRVRTYKTVNGVKYYSGWSTVKSAKTK